MLKEEFKKKLKQNYSTRLSKQLISISSLSFSYNNLDNLPSENKILDNISFDINAGDFVAILGPNGSGKTTLLKIILGFLSPTAGKVSLFIPLEKIGYVPQRYTIDKNFPGTVQEILNTGDISFLKKTGIEQFAERKFVNLSGGQQQRVLIALALRQNTPLLILDEPTAGIDIHAQQEFYQLLKQLNKHGLAIVLVTHEVGVIPSLVKKVICINHQLCCIGKPQEIPRLLEKMYGPDFSVHRHKHRHKTHRSHQNSSLERSK